MDRRTKRERRNHPRINFEVKLTVSDDPKFTRARADDCVITDITKTGLGFISSYKFEVGENSCTRQYSQS